MESSVSSGMCRCCASEGTFKDINAKYYWMGEEEIYSEMLNDCFNISLNESSQNGDSGICEVCITQLRNSVNFKKQVLNTEDQFKNHLESKMFKECEIKVEYTQEDSTMESESNGSDEDYSAIEFVVPLKKEEEDSKPKKRSSSSKPSTSRGKKPKKERVNKSTSKSTEEIGKQTLEKNNTVSMTQNPKKPTEIAEVRSSKPLRIMVPRYSIRNLNVSMENKESKSSIILKKNSFESNTRRPKICTESKYSKNVSTVKKFRENITMILENSNATLLKTKGVMYLCSYCTEEFPEPKKLKSHIIEKHDKKNIMQHFVTSKYYPRTTRLDITGLQCKLCNCDLDTLESFIEHIFTVHKKLYHQDITNNFVPFKFDDDEFRCFKCFSNFISLKTLCEHMTNIHYRNYVCDNCEAGFLTKQHIKNHMMIHVDGTYKCKYCLKTFPTIPKKQYHERVTHTSYRGNRCWYCNLTFAHANQKIDHVVKVHGGKQKLYKCKSCDKTFIYPGYLKTHMRRDHMLERPFKCSYCERTFFKKPDLRDHEVKHTRVRDYICVVCSKAFLTRNNLMTHMKVHDDSLRTVKYNCEMCEESFYKKNDLKKHFTSIH